jgi:hypothetical protein
MPKPDPSYTPDPPLRPYMYPNPRYWEAVQLMANRMCMSEPKYGDVADTYPEKGDALRGLRDRLAKYEETGNTEWLIDVANMALIEHLHPAHPDAHFVATPSEASPGFPERGA